MKKMRLITIIFSIVFTFFITSLPASAADNMMDNLLPKETDQKQEGKVKLEYNKYSLSSYGMDTQLEQSTMSDMMPWGWDESVGKEINQAMQMTNSTLWGFNKIIASCVGTIVSESFNSDFVKSFSSDTSKAISAIAGFGPGGYQNNGLWPYLVTSMVVFLGIWAAYVAILKRSSSQAMSGILSSIIIMTLALGFFANSEKILNGINDGTSEVQNDVLSISMSALTPGNFTEREGISSMRNQIFNLMVKKPYLLLQFGTTDEQKIESEWKKGGSRVDTLLKTPWYSKERTAAVKYEVDTLKNDNLKPTALTDRFVILILLLIMNSIMGGTLCLLAGSMIFFQVLALVFALFTPIAFLIGLIPAFSHTATNIAMKLFHAFYMKIALSLLTTVLFTISSMVYNAMNPNSGYIMLFIIQIICYVAIWVKRNSILNIVTVPFRKIQANNTLGQNVGDYKKTYFKGKKYFNKFSKPFTKPVAPLAERTGFNKIQANPGVGVVNPMTHPNYAPVTRKKPTEAPVSVKSSSPAKPSMRNDQKTNAPVERAQQPAPVTTTGNKNVSNPAPALNDRSNLENLEQTLDKGGWSHHTKETVQLKGKPALQDRLVERQTVAVSDHKQQPKEIYREPEPIDRPELKDRREEK